MTEEEEIHNEEEQVIEEGEDPSTIEMEFSETPDPVYLPLDQEFKDGIEKFKTFVPDIAVRVDLTNKIYFSIESSLFPIALRTAFGFLEDKILLDFEIELDNFDWKKKPITCNIVNPNSFIYCGKFLVEKVISTFFSPSYKPKKFYRCAPIFLTAQKDSDSQVERRIQSSGFSHMQAVRSSSLCDNDYDRSILFLLTGQYQLDESFKYPISYIDCPLLFLVLEVFEVLINLQDHCLICGRMISSSLRARPCDQPQCKYCFYERAIRTTIINEIIRDRYVTDLLYSTFSIAQQSDYYYPKLPPIENPTDRTKNIGNELLNEIIHQIPSMKQLSTAIKDNDLNEFKPILTWVILSCKTNLFYLPKNTDIKMFRSKGENPPCHQFMALMSSPEQENIFLQLKKKYNGSKYLFCGIPVERWHSIIRSGLNDLNVAHHLPTNFLVDEGIYLTEKSLYAIDFAHKGRNKYGKSELGNVLNIVAVCEVANLPNSNVTFDAVINGEDPSTKKTKTVMGCLKNHQWCYTLTMSEACIVRFLLVNFSVDNINLSTAKIDFPSIIEVMSNKGYI